jgi:hypothetical protein
MVNRPLSTFVAAERRLAQRTAVHLAVSPAADSRINTKAQSTQ